MKKLGNVAKIGDAALLNYYQEKFGNDKKTTISLNKIDADLQKIYLDGAKMNWLYVWSIESGIQNVEIPKELSKDSLYFLSRFIKSEEQLEKISHFIIIGGGWHPAIQGNGRSVEIYRLAKVCKKLIQTNWSWIEAFGEDV